MNTFDGGAGGGRQPQEEAPLRRQKRGCENDTKIKLRKRDGAT